MITIRSFMLLLTFLLLPLSGARGGTRGMDVIDLSGEWRYRLVSVPDTADIPEEGFLKLPGTLDTNGVGIPVPASRETTQLSRRVTYTGPVTYSRTVTIPESWEDKEVILEMERTRPSTVMVDGISAGFRNALSAPHIYDLTGMLTPGTHVVEITVDNGSPIPVAVRNSSHACSESTQTNWNGILGNLRLSALGKTRISSLRVVPDPDRRGFSLEGDIKAGGNEGALILTARTGASVADTTYGVDSTTSYNMFLPLSQEQGLWSEWSPETVEISLTLSDSKGNTLDSRTVATGCGRLSAKGTVFTINGDTTFLRGRHDGCVWPLTGHVPMDRESWERYFTTMKEYGLNHVRFHSWCPPEAAFAAADGAGFYLQPELPIWGEVDNSNARLRDFLEEDLEAMTAAYGHHPSFAMFAVGNELWGDIETMRGFMDTARRNDPGLLATFGSNIYLGWNGHIEGEDFLVTCRTRGGDPLQAHTRASFSFSDADNGGLMNSMKPNTVMNFSGGIAGIPVPVVGHETGQYQSYPDYSTIPKYTGVLRPDNLIEFRDRAGNAGLLRKGNRFARDSGRWAALLYKADMEMNLRTPGMGGFQLLDIQDYPGQGTALVGVLDPFLDPKGTVTVREWRQSCAPLTVMAELPKFAFTEGETVEIPLVVNNATGKDKGGERVCWKLPFASGATEICKGKGVVGAGSIMLTMPRVKHPVMVNLSLAAGDSVAANEYPLWIYPRKKALPLKKVTLTSSLDSALILLEKGKKVVLMPDSATVAESTVGPLFTTDYWNYRMFRTISEKMGKPVSPGTLGLSIDAGHGVFSQFPTESHTNWQWFPVVSNSRPLIADRLPDTFDPIVEAIDNTERNYPLFLMFECRVDKGRLVVLMSDLEKTLESAEGHWLLQSVCSYASSGDFKPAVELTPRQLRDLLTRPSSTRRINELQNPSY